LVESEGQADGRIKPDRATPRMNAGHAWNFAGRISAKIPQFSLPSGIQLRQFSGERKSRGTPMVDGSTQYYYLDGARNQQGPVSAADIARLVRSGTIARETLMWFAGMPDWRPAGQINELASLFGPPAGAPAMRPPMPPGGGAPRGPAPAASQNATGSRSSRLAPGGALVADYPVWGLFWRTVVFGFCSGFIIPAPWCIAALYRYIIGHVSLPDGQRFTFAGRGGDVWYLFIGPVLAIIVLTSLALFIPAVAYLNVLIELFLGFVVPYLVIRWVVEKVGTEDGSVKLAFTGSILGLIGYSLLLMLSVITIVGWAWVMAAQTRWLCRNVNGTHQFEFTGTGLEILWRYLVFALASSLIIPIPWMLRWYMSWLVSQTRVAQAHG
jgi:hypothetical protein